MNFIGIFLLMIGLFMIIFPEFLSYIIGGFFLFLGLNIVLFNMGFNNKKSKNHDERGDFIKIGKYKIYK